MAGVDVGSAYMTVIPTAKGFGSTLQRELGGEIASAAGSAGDTAGRGFKGRFGGALRGMGAGIAGAFASAVPAITGFFAGAVDEAREGQKVGALTEQVIKTTGGAAKVTAEQVADLAGAISAKTGVDDEAIQSASNLLLTFTNLRNEAGKGNDVFNQATQIATDMGAALGQEPKAAAIALGKALNDPIKGVTALTRVGVSFTAQQKSQIEQLVKSGDTLGAQKIILGELRKEFGGAAEASANSSDKLKVAFGNFQEQVGTALLPIIDKVADFLTTKIIPALSKFVGEMESGEGLGGDFADALKTVGEVIGDIVTFLSEHPEILGGVIESFTLGVGLFKQTADAIGFVVKLFKDLPGAVGDVTGTLAGKGKDLVTGLGKGVYDNIAGFTKWWRDLPGNVVKWTGNTASTLSNKGKNFITGLAKGTYDNVSGFTRWWGGLRGNVTSWVGDTSSTLGTRGKNFVVGLAKGTYDNVGSFSRWWGELRGKVSGWVGDTLGTLGNKGKNLIVGFARGVFENASGLSRWLGELPGNAVRWIGDLGSTLYNKGASLIQGLIDGIKSKLSAVGDAMSSVTSKIGSFLPGSPIREGPLRSWNNGGAGRRLMDMVAEGILAGHPQLAAAMTTATSGLNPGVGFDATPAGAGSFDGNSTYVTVLLDGEPVRAMVKAENTENARGIRRAVTSRGR